jgi:flagellar operon protein
MNKIGNQFSSIELLTDQYLKKEGTAAEIKQTGKTFQEILEQTNAGSETAELKFSKHASMRLQSRNINLSAEQKERLETGADKAQAKGIRESLVLVDSLAFIVNVPNRTVVTAMEQAESAENIYTNIDGAVII